MYKNYVLVVLLSLFIGSPVTAMEPYDESASGRRVNLKIDPDKYIEFKKIKEAHYGRTFLAELKQFPQKSVRFYEVIKPNGETFHVLGTSHILPLEVLPEPVLTRLEGASHVYIESSSSRRLASFKASNTLLTGFSDEEKEAINKSLNPLLALFHANLKGTDLDLKDIYSLFFFLDQSKGMDLEIEISSLSRGKLVLLLDDPAEDRHELWIRAVQLELQDDLDNASCDEEKESIARTLTLVQNDPDAYFLEFVKEHIAYKDFQTELQSAVRDSLEAYYNFTLEDLGKEMEEDPDAKYHELKERNEEWIDINILPNSVVVPGYGHLPDLISKWRQKNYIVNELL